MARSTSTSHEDLATLTEGAMVVALSVVLGSVRLLELPNGGSIAFGTLPILLFALVRGYRAAFLAGWCAGIAHALAGGTIVHPAQFLLDYGLAYAVLAAAALGHGTSRVRMAAGVVAAMCAHLACFVASGMLFFAQYAGTQSPFAFSLAYNASTVVPETLLAIWALPVLVRAYARSTPANATRCGLLDTTRVARAQRAAHAGHVATFARSAPPAPTPPAPATSAPAAHAPTWHAPASPALRIGRAAAAVPRPRERPATPTGIAGRPAPLGFAGWTGARAPAPSAPR